MRGNSQDLLERLSYRVMSVTCTCIRDSVSVCVRDFTGLDSRDPYPLKSDIDVIFFLDITDLYYLLNFVSDVEEDTEVFTSNSGHHEKDKNL